MASSSYLTPQWLMSDIQQLLSRSRSGVKKHGFGDVLSKKEFEDEYLEGQETGLASQERYKYTYDFGDDYEDRYTWDDTHDTNVYKFGRKGGAYDAYLASLGYTPETGYGAESANIFDPASFVTGIQRAGGLPIEGASSEGFTAFTPEMFKQLRTEYYQPQIESQKGSLVDKLIARSRLASAKGGGFSGYGGRERARQSVEEQYATGVENIYADVEQEKTRALEDIYGTLDQYSTLRT